MLTNPDCPVCGANAWAVVGERAYKNMQRENPRQAKPLRVLFEIWAPGAEEFKVEFVACTTCGMMIYRPRPSAADLEAKYKALAQYGDNIPGSGEAPKRTRLRSKRLADLLKPHMSGPLAQSRILDFGGGDGRLLTVLAEAGATCDLLDYCDAPVPGVTQIGHTMEELPNSPTYDAVICSHVVEHLAEPLEVLQRLVANLKSDGVIYVEVPVEMVKRMPAGTEPVTHCNFFIPESLTALLQRAGCDVLKCELACYPHPNGGWTLCAGAIATPGTSKAMLAAGLPAVQKYLDPSPAFLVQLAAKMWRIVPAIAARKIMARMRSTGVARAKSAGPEPGGKSEASGLAVQQPANTAPPAPAAERIAVSVIIPVYRDWERLERCLAALGQQSLDSERFEIIVANNEEQGDCPLPSLPANARVVHEPQPGSYNARNAAIAVARGEYLAFTDSDCVPDGDWLRNGLKLLRAHPGARVGGPVSIFREPETSDYAFLYDLHTAFPQREYVASGVCVTANLMAPKEVFERIGAFDPCFSGGDIDWNRRAQAAGIPIVYGEDVKVTHPARHDLGEILKKRRRAAGSKRLHGAPARFVMERLKPPVRRFVRLRRQQVGWRDAALVVGIHWLARLDQAREFSLIRLGLKQPNRS